MKQTLTPVEAMRLEVEYTKQEVLDVTGLTVEQQGELMFDQAYEYLSWMGCDSDMQKHFATTPEFWAFWKKVWYDMDRQFLSHYFFNMYDRAYTRDCYSRFHDCTFQRMNSSCMNAAYHNLIKTLAVKR
jgi:hypothetical protein